MKEEQQYEITICSDSVGETAEAVVRATIRQFDAHQVRTKRIGHIKTEDEIRTIMEEAAKRGGFVAYTLVQPELREMMKEEAVRLGVRAVDIMGPMMQAFIDTWGDAPKRKPGLLHQLDEDYFRRVEAIEFAVKCDDGRDTSALLKANLVLIGVSRTSKTPLSIFLAHKGIKVSNLPLVPEVKPPKELFLVPGNRIVGLTMDADKLYKIRTERLKAVGLPFGAKYAAMERIDEELRYAQALMKQVGCLVINVTDKAIEETAGIIMGYLN
ncbi:MULTISPECIES: pyruvate, water dikinase regulatory protein [Paenibacillus]|uniref:Putative pyruvate, phosphate dikinase regulatory protein n=3 Tax=Paenibacillus TaxID=44249 RepID=A0A081NXG5_9BACL|nr:MULTISPECIES: pyruvate, water dikinase regulatory protein [Paenibacillus]KEQ23138.1 phosphotransferase [Paenibacillus tyrfis]KPV59139.1 phosphotransferase [Paenibacillus sp. A3]KZE74754.1 phosphoenolpyruvate synthase regulatory protein [Paenibacillus elgii]MBU7320786.1 kinase/pyrophosphorylase [Paenibacillus oleatilyticus]MCP1311762.1 kinase/pyrophosphorylase [Paenibacillus tyrfis]